MRTRARLHLTPLEDRAVPATLYTVTGAADDDTPDAVLTLREALLAQRGDISLAGRGEAAHVADAPGLAVDTIRFDAPLAGATITFAASDTSAANRYGRTGFVVGALPGATGVRAVAIDGTAGSGRVTLSGGGTERMFAVTATGDLALANLTLTNGLARGGNGGGGAAGLGGAVFVDGGALTILGSTLTGNTAAGGNGGSTLAGGVSTGGGGLFSSAASIAGGGPNGASPGGPILGRGPGWTLWNPVYVVVGQRPDQAAGFGGGGGTGVVRPAGTSSGGTGSGGPGGPPATGGGNPSVPLYAASLSGGAGGFGGGGGGGAGVTTGSYSLTPGFGGRGGFGGGAGGAGGPMGITGNPFGGTSTLIPGAPGTGGGGAGLGGAVFNNAGAITIRDSVFTANRAAGGTGANAGKGLGGAVFSRNGSLAVIGTTFGGNTAADGGVSVYVLSDAVSGGAADVANTGAAAIAAAGNTLDPGAALVTATNGAAAAVAQLPAVSAAATTPAVSERGGAAGRFTVTRTGDTSAALTVSYSLSGTAVAGTDYVMLPGSVAFVAGSPTATIDVNPVDNARLDGVRTVTLTLTAGPGYAVAPGTAEVSIADDENGVSVAAADAAERRPGEEAAPGRFTFTRTGDLTLALTVGFTAGGTAAAGDFAPLPASVTFSAGSATATVDVTPVDNAVTDGPRTVTLALAPGSGYVPVAPAAAVVSILDNDAPVTAAATVPTAAERRPGQAPAPGQFTLTRGGDLTRPLTVVYALGGTAAGGRDYRPLPGAVTFAPGAATATVSVEVLDNDRFDGTRTVMLELSPGVGYVATAAGAVVSIRDDDALVSVAATDPSAAEGVTADPGTFTLTRAGDLSGALTVTYTLTGSAANGVAYRAVPTSVTFAPGQATAAVVVTPVNNSTIDGIRTAVLTLAGGPGYEVGGAPAAVTIQDNDAPIRRVAVGTAGLGAVKVYDNGSIDPTFSFLPYPGYTGGVSVAVGDVTGDGVPDIVTGATDLSSHVKVFDGVTGAEIASFFAFVNFNNGVGVAVGDLDNDGKAEVIVGALTAAPHVKVFGLAGGAAVERASYLAFPGSVAGVSVAAGDTDGDGRAEIVVGARAAPHVKTFDLLGNQLHSFLVPGLAGGIAVGAGDVDGDRVAEILVGGTAGGAAAVAVLNAAGGVRAWAQLDAGAVVPAVAAADADGDGRAELFVGGGPLLDELNGRALGRRARLAPFPGYRGGLFVG